MISVLKASGISEPFSEEKVRLSLQRTGASPEIIIQVLNSLHPKLYDKISTKEIYGFVFELLNKLQKPISLKFNLKKAIMALGPSGFPFEKFVSGILEHYGYQTKINQVIQGKCIDHEIDIIASKNDKNYLIECKFHNQQGIKTNTKVALYTYAELLDIQAIKKDIKEAWLITNTKVTEKVKKYACCTGLKITSWDYPQDFSLTSLINKRDLYPITCLDSLAQSHKNLLLENNIVFCHDLLTKKIPFVQNEKLEIAKREVLDLEKS